MRNIADEFEFVKYDPEKLKGFETYADEEDFYNLYKNNKKSKINMISKLNN